MTTKADFSENDWKLLTRAPSIAGMYITLASPSLTDSIKESAAVAGKIADVAKNKNGGELVNAVVGDFKDFASVREAQPQFEARELEGIKAEALSKLRSAADVVNRNASESDAAEYRQWVYDVAVAAAEAAKEGDVLGFGGVRVSEEEKAALTDIAGALGLAM